MYLKFVKRTKFFRAYENFIYNQHLNLRARRREDGLCDRLIIDRSALCARHFIVIHD